MNPVVKRIKIVEIVRNIDRAQTFVVEPLDGWQPQYKAGQFITLIFYNHLGEQRRSFSLSSSPEVDTRLFFTVKKLDNGEFSRQLLYRTKVGDIFETTGIGGFFILPAQTKGKTFCFLAAGSGITPCFSIIKTLLKTTEENIILVYSNQSESDALFYEPLQQLQQQYAGRFQIQFMFSNRTAILERRLSHYVLSHFMEKKWAAGQKQQAFFYICGPYEYMLMAEISLKSNGISGKQIIKEDFFPLKRMLKPAPPDIEAHMVTVHTGDTVYTFTVQYPDTIIAAAKKAGIRLPYSCESGQCGSCVATCVTGKIWMAYNEVLTDKEIIAGRVLPCQGYPIGGAATLFF